MARVSHVIRFSGLLVLVAVASALAEGHLGKGPVSAVAGGKGVPIYFAGTEDGIRSALDTLRQTGGVVSLDRGDYKITRPLVVWDGTMLIGTGEDTRLIAVGGPTSKMTLLFVGSNCRVLSLNFIGMGYSREDWKAYGSHGIVAGTHGIGGMSHSRIEGCFFRDWNTNAIDVAPGSSGNEITNNHIVGSGWEGIYLAQHCDSNLVQENWINSCRRNAIDVVGSFNLIKRNHISGVGQDSTSLTMDTDGILMYSREAITGPVRGNEVVENTIQGAFNGISVLAAPGSDQEDVLIRGNRVTNCRSAGIKVGGGLGNPKQTIRNISIENNDISGCDSSGVLLVDIPTGVSIRGNHLYTNRGDGIRVMSKGDQVRGITIAKNAIISNARRGIYAAPPTCVLVKSDNVLEGNAEGPNGGASASAKSSR